MANTDRNYGNRSIDKIIPGPFPSTASIAGHPIHPSLIPFPVAYLVAAAFTDIAFHYSGDPFWVRASLWLIGAGVIMAMVAGLFGIIDFMTRSEIRRLAYAWFHGVGNLVILILAIINWSLRLNDENLDVLTITNGETALSVIVAIGVMATAWIGGEMTFKGEIGTNPTPLP